MELQTIIVGITISFAFTYFGLIMWRKCKSFSVKSNNCGSDCACASKESKSHFLQK